MQADRRTDRQSNKQTNKQTDGNANVSCAASKGKRVANIPLSSGTL